MITAAFKRKRKPPLRYVCAKRIIRIEKWDLQLQFSVKSAVSVNCLADYLKSIVLIHCNLLRFLVRLCYDVFFCVLAIEYILG